MEYQTLALHNKHGQGHVTFMFEYDTKYSHTVHTAYCVKFHLESSYKDLLRTSKFGSKWTRI